MPTRLMAAVAGTLACLLGILLYTSTHPLAQTAASQNVGITGTVTNAATRAAEAGVWVVAETDSLPTRFRRIVVTDARGRFVVPDLPEGAYRVWVRGYGLRDSTPVSANRGQALALQASTAGSQAEAARIYPSSYWLSLFRLPAPAEVPTGFEGAAHWMTDVKLGCMRCHQLGASVFHKRMGIAGWEDEWKDRPFEGRTADTLGHAHFTKALADWTARIAAGDLPPVPARPVGIERNVVVTEWEWAGTNSYVHDLTATDKRRPTLYPYGKVWGVDFGHDELWSLDPKTHRVASFKVPTTNVLPPQKPARPDAIVYNNPANPHVPIMDDRGVVWIAVQTRRERPEDSAPWARDVLVNVQAPSGTPPAALAAWDEGTHHRQLVSFDTAQERFTTIETAYGTNHLQFDDMGRLWTSGDSVALGMFDPAKFDPQHPRETAMRAQRAFVSIDPQSGRSVGGGGYGITVNPKDGTVWRTNTYIGQTGASDNVTFAGQNLIIAFNPKTSRFKSYPLPAPARSPIGIDASTDGKIWFGTASGHLGRLDPATERFTYWVTPGPKPAGAGAEVGSTDFHYSIFVDQHDTLGLGRDTVVLTGANSDALVVFNPATEHFLVVRVPYPMGMYHRGIDGRIDDLKAGWKGRGLWLDYGGDPSRFTETGRGTIVHVQVRPDPLAN